jgi:K(+)-stimulated pyrophosphate-energized sodium pump
MTHQPPEVRKRTDALDSLGNTTAATGKGFAIGSAALTALALLAAYVEEVRVGQNRQAMTTIVQHRPQAQSEAKAGLGELFYMGHQKFAMKTKEGTSQYAFSAFMALSDVPRSVQPGVAADYPNWQQMSDEQKTTLQYLGVPLVSARKATLRQYMAFYDVTLMNPKVLCGLLSGVLLVFLFSALTMKAVGRAANAMVKEVRRQFKEIAGIMEGTATPDYARCVDISTAGAQKEMVLPSLLALIVPVAVGLLLGVPGVLGLLAGGLSCGFAVAVFMANAGGAWDNAKKWIETGQLGGKGSDQHKAAVVGDTVGDPFKDTSGPSLNILIKLMSMVSVVFAGLVVKYAPMIANWLHLGP